MNKDGLLTIVTFLIDEIKSRPHRKRLTVGYSFYPQLIKMYGDKIPFFNHYNLGNLNQLCRLCINSLELPDKISHSYFWRTDNYQLKRCLSCNCALKYKIDLGLETFAFKEEIDNILLEYSNSKLCNYRVNVVLTIILKLLEHIDQDIQYTRLWYKRDLNKITDITYNISKLIIPDFPWELI